MEKTGSQVQLLRSVTVSSHYLHVLVHWAMLSFHMVPDALHSGFTPATCWLQLGRQHVYVVCVGIGVGFGVGLYHGVGAGLGTGVGMATHSVLPVMAPTVHWPIGQSTHLV
jgi:hypothetical protein